MSRLVRLLLPLLALVTLSGCGALSGVSVQTAKTVTKAPGNVLVYVSVEDGGKPVDNLSASNFDVYENDLLLDRGSTHLELLPRDTAADGHTVLLLDLSGDIGEKDLTRISRGAAQFVEKVSTTQAVSVLVFDGSPETRLVARFPRVETAEKRELPDLTPFVTGDDSRNLNGGIVDAIAILEDQLAFSMKPVQLGTLVTLVRGPDLAGRKSDDDVYRAIDKSDYEFYAVHEKKAAVKTLPSIGRDNRTEFETIDTLPMSLQEVGMKVRKAWGRNYLVSYCSPARGGDRDVKVSVHFTSDRGDARRGKTRTGFNSDGFEAGCGPLRPVLRAKQEAEAREAEAQAKAEAEAAEERRKAEERVAAKARADEAQRKAAAANAAARQAVEGGPVDEPDEEGAEGADDGAVVAPPSSGDYE
jgi:hypothetical protein